MTRRAQEAAAVESPMRVVMTKTTRGSEDGIRVQLYEEGETYTVGGALGKSFVQSKRARLAPEEKPKQDPPGGAGSNPPAGGDEKKGGQGPDDNKGGKGPGENK